MPWTLLSIIFLIFSTASVNAANYSQIKADVTNIESEIAKLQAELTEKRDKLNRLSGQSIGQGHFSINTDSMQPEIDAAFAQYEKAKKEIEPKLERYRRELNNKRTELEAANRSANAGNRQFSSLKELLQVTNLSMDLDRLNYKLKDNESLIHEMERVYDKAFIGTYIKHKMTNLLNSKALCEAQKSCSQGKAKVSATSIESELFNSSSSSRSTRRAAPGQGGRN